MDDLITIARKHSEDPAQEQLRSQKALWNKSTSGFIAKLIAFKKAMNGKGDPRFGLPASNIKMPLPTELTSYLHQLIDEYSSIVHGAEDLFHQQEEYSQHRNQKQAELISEASWWGSRFWTKNVKMKGTSKPYLTRMLNAGADMHRLLLDMENITSSSDPNYLVDLSYYLNKILFTKFNGMVEDLKLWSKNSNPILEPNPNKSPALPSSNLQEPTNTELESLEPETKIDWNLLSEIKLDLSDAEAVITTLILKKEIPIEFKSNLSNIKKTLAFISRWKQDWKSLNEGKKQEILKLIQDKIVEPYQELLMIGKASINNEAVNFKELNLALQTPKLAHNPLTRFLKQKLLQTPFFGKEDREVRLRLNETIKSVIIKLDQLLNTIETLPAHNEIMNGIKNLAGDLIFLIELVKDAARMHNISYNHFKDREKPTNLQHITEKHITLLNQNLNNLKRIVAQDE